MAAEPTYEQLKDALREVIVRPELAQQLRRSETKGKAIATLGIDEVVRTDLINILTLWEESPAPELDAARKHHDTRAQSRPSDDTEQAIISARSFLDDSFRQVRRAYQVSMAMSGLIFAVGVAFLVLAAIRSVSNPSQVAANSVIGGIGIVQIVALFYRNPLVHIARTVSNAQQARMAVTSYLLGLSMLYEQIGPGAPTDGHLKCLTDLTEMALRQMQRYVEEATKATRPNK